MENLCHNNNAFYLVGFIFQGKNEICKWKHLVNCQVVYTKASCDWCFFYLMVLEEFAKEISIKMTYFSLCFPLRAVNLFFRESTQSEIPVTCNCKVPHIYKDTLTKSCLKKGHLGLTDSLWKNCVSVLQFLGFVLRMFYSSLNQQASGKVALWHKCMSFTKEWSKENIYLWT